MNAVADHPLYSLLLNRCQSDAHVERVLIGLTWTCVELDNGAIGLGMTLGGHNRTLPWSGNLSGRRASELAEWLLSWNPWEAAVGLATANAMINHEQCGCCAPDCTPIGEGNLAVFDYFLPRLKGQKVAVIGRYPGLQRFESRHEIHVIERLPGGDDYPDPASEYLLPNMDWVFLTASSLGNKTFPRLAELCEKPNTVLMGPSVPWLPELAEFNIDFLAGVSIESRDQLFKVIGEGGGTRIFGEAVQYQVMDLRQREMDDIRENIRVIWEQREKLKNQLMQGTLLRDGMRQLERLDEELSALDSRYVTLWTPRQPFPHWSPAGLPRGTEFESQ